MKISIIIPVFNRENMIGTAIKSLLKQSYTNYEIIIVDDGSNDKSKSIIAKFTEQSDKIFYYFQENRGVAAARNTGLEKVNGEFVCFLDSDDSYAPSFLEKMISKIKNENSDVCYCGYVLENAKGNKNGKTKFSRENVLLKYIKGVISVQTAGWMIRTDLIVENKIKFRSGVSWGEDVEFFYRILGSTDKISYVNEYLVYYWNEEDDSRLSNFTIEKIDQDYNFISHILDNSSINSSLEMEKALIEDRLSPLITYKLWRALNSDIDNNLVKAYYNKYFDYISKYTWRNGLRSIKLNYYKFKLKSKIKKL